MDGTGTVVTIFTAGLNGSIVDSITLAHLGTNVATVIRLFVKDGATYTLIDEVTMVSNTISQVAASTTVERIYDGVNRKRLTLKPSASLVASTGTVLAAGVRATTFGGDY